ncbi:hypothetical protein B0I37DRAFT_437256 [Chaetomium sp. MPI-CAGE-AT-0009]|nr:hypothetical protein B0I37DRAFT_437256 [Chaetomium sp. MPI-CAGE-AT-0009]
MAYTFEPVIWYGNGHIVDIAFSEELQTAFLGILDGTICQVVSNDWQGGRWGERRAYSAFHDGGGLEYLRIIKGDPEQLVSIASDGSVLVWNIIGGTSELQHVRTLHGFHSLTPPRIIACRRAGVNAPKSTRTAGHTSNFLVFATDDGALNWWDLENFSSNATHLDGLDLITALDIDIAEDLISVGTVSGQVRVWRMSTLAYVFHAVVPGAVTKLAFLPEEWRRRQLALVTNETSLQIHTFDSNSGRQMKPPMDVRGYPDTEVFELYPMDINTLFVMGRNGAVTILLREGGNFQTAYRDPPPPSMDPSMSPPLNASLLLAMDSGELLSFISYPYGNLFSFISRYDVLLYRGRAVSSIHGRRLPSVEYSDMYPKPHIRNDEIQETHFPLGGFASAHGLIHGDSETPDPGTQDLPTDDDNPDSSDTDGKSFGGNSAYSGQSSNSDLDSDGQDTSLDTSVEDLSDDSRLHLRTVRLGHPASNFIPRLENARQRYNPPAGETSSDTDHICQPQDPALGGAPLPRPRNVEDIKNHARFLASLISGKIWNHDHLDRFSDAIKDNEADRQTWLSTHETHEKLLKAERSKMGDKSGRKKLGGYTFEELQEHANARYEAKAKRICDRATVEKQADTIAVGISPDKKDIFIAGNVKKCEDSVLRGMGSTGPHGGETSSQGGATSTPFGLHDNKYNNAIWDVLQKWYPEATRPGVDVHILAPDIHPKTVNDMRKFHGETQIVAFSNQNKIAMPIIGVSKPPCHRCDEALTAHGVEHGHNAIKEPNMRVREDRWESNYINTMPRRQRHESRSNARPSAQPRTSPAPLERAYTTPRVTPPLKLTPAGLAKTTVVHPIQNRRPRISVGIGATIESVIDTWDRPGYADAGLEYADAGVYETRMTRGVYAQAGCGIARAGCTVAEAEARGPNVSAGAQFGYLSGVSVFAHAEAVSAQASLAGVTAKVGLNANTGFSAGVDGLAAGLTRRFRIPALFGTGRPHPGLALDDHRIPPNTAVTNSILNQRRVLCEGQLL